MTKIIERNVPIAEENETLSGQPAKNMFEDWSEEMSERADNPYHSRSDEPQTELEREKRLREMDEIVKEDIENTKP